MSTAQPEPTPAVITEAEMAEPTAPTIPTTPTHVMEGGDAPASDSQEVVFVDEALPPRKKGNRLVGSAFSLLAALVFGAIFAGVIIFISAVIVGEVSFTFLQAQTFYVPIVLFFVAMILLVLLVNRAGWWAFLIGSLVVALFVYFGTAGILLLLDNAIAKTPAAAAFEFQLALINPLVIAAGIIAREVAIWFGALISWRGRRVKARNVVAREDFDREQAELKGT